MLRLHRFVSKAISSRPTAGQDALPLAVLEFQSPTSAIIAMPAAPMAAYTNWFVSAFVVSMLVAAGFIPVDKIVSGTGEVVSSAPDSSIQAFSAASIVQSINVHPGDLVQKGQVLAALNPTYAAADLASMTQQEQGYAAQVAQLQAQESGVPYLGAPSNPSAALQLQTYKQQIGQYDSTMQDYAQKISELRTNIAGSEAQAAYFRQRLGVATDVENMRKTLQKLMVGSRLDTLNALNDRLNVQGELANAVSSAASSRRELAAQEAERDAFAQQWKVNISQQLSTALVNLAQAQQQLAKAKLNNSLVALTAPQDSIVQSIAAVAPGSVLQAGQQLMDLAPVDAPLLVEADINAAESGYVQVGDKVVIKFATLPFLQFGAAEGTIRSISPESVNPLDLQAMQTNGPLLPGAPQSLFYKAQISIDALNLHNTPSGFRLVPGMPIEADVKVGKRSVLRYFLQQILPVAFDSMHEPVS
jgi:hemolysin D